MRSEKQIWMHLVIYLILFKSLLAHRSSSAGEYRGADVRGGKRLKILRVESGSAHDGARLSPPNSRREDIGNAIGDSQSVKDVAQVLLDQEQLMDEATSKTMLVKRFVDFLKSAYPREVPVWSEMVENRVRRGTGLLHRKRRFIIKSRRRKQQSGKDKEKPEPKMQTGSCGCKSVTECPEADEPDKFRMFFSNPPLCRPTPTANPIDDVPFTDMCGHSCKCHNTEPLTTDNDKEIYVGRRKTTDFRIK